MSFDITVKHPSYEKFASAWSLMRDTFDGEECVKAAGEKYLPMKSGTKAMTNWTLRDAAYDAYRLRAEFPELVAPTIRGTVGLMFKHQSQIELPPSMEFLREKATVDGLTLDELHRRIAVELTLMGRYGLLPGIGTDNVPYIAGYTTETIINWDNRAGVTDFVVLNETAPQRDVETGKWGTLGQYRECALDNEGRFFARVWEKNAEGTWIPGEPVYAADRKNQPLGILPFVFVGTNDLTEDPDDVPLYGLGRLSIRIYRMDADYTTSLHLTADPTPVVIGFSDTKAAREAGQIPTSIGSSALWVIPMGGDAKMLEFTGAGISAQEKAINDALNRAIAFGSQILTDTSKTAESGDALQIRLGSQNSLLYMIAMNSAAGLEKALRNVAIWLGEDPTKVTVTPNLEFFDQPLTAQELTALIAGWQANAYSYKTMFDRLKRGTIIPPDRTEEEEKQAIAEDPFTPDMMDVNAGAGAVPDKISRLPQLLV